MAVAANDNWLAGGDADGTVNIYNLTGLNVRNRFFVANDELRTLGKWENKAPSGADVISSLVWLKDGRLLVGGLGGTAALWDATTKTGLWRVDLRDPVQSMSLSPDERRIVVRARRYFYVLECDRGVEIKRYARSRATGDGVFSPDGKAVLTGHRDGVARLWDSTIRIWTTSHGRQPVSR